MKTSGFIFRGSSHGHVPRHSTILRKPETLLRDWSFFRDEASGFLAWLRAKGAKGGKPYSNNTLHRYMCEFRKLCRLMHERGLSLRELSYRLYMELKARGSVKFPEVVKLYLRYLYELTEDERYLKLYQKIRVPIKKNSLAEVLTKDQLSQLLDACGRVGGIELKTLVAITYESGARIGEILSLKARDVTFDRYGARLFIRVSKSEVRTVRLLLYAKLLALYMESTSAKGDEPLFRRNYNTYLRMLTKAWRLAGLPAIKRKFHVLRHTRATEMLKERILSEKEMMLWFGWKTRGMIDVYARISNDDVERAYLAHYGVKDVGRADRRVKYCKSCKEPNPYDARFCLGCGAPLSEESDALKELISLLSKPEVLELIRRIGAKHEQVGL